MKKTVFYLLWLVVIFFAIKLASIALAYFSFDMQHNFLKAKQHLLGNTFWVVCFYVHLFFGSVATLLGFPLFFKRIIAFKSNTHKNIGKIYILSILFFTGPTGVYLAFFAEGGHWSSVGFLMMSCAWMLPTYMAYYSIVNKDLKAHYRWIIRSYCMTLSGVTLRVFTPIGVSVFGFDYTTNFVVSSFVWIFNVALGELILLANKKQQNNLDALIS